MANVPLDYAEVLGAVERYYKAGSDQWLAFQKYGLAAQDLENILSPLEGVTIYKNNAGKIIGYGYQAPCDYTDGGISGALNSNVQQASQANGNTFKANIPASGTIDQSGNAQLSSGAKSAATGLTVSTVLDKVALGVAGVNLGCKFGAFIDSAIYAAAPDFWDDVCPTINPQTWDNIASTQAGKSFFNALFGIDKDTGSTQMYLPEDVVAYMALMMKQQNFFPTGGEQVVSTDVTFSGQNILPINIQSPPFKVTSGSTRYEFYTPCKCIAQLNAWNRRKLPYHIMGALGIAFLILLPTLLYIRERAERMQYVQRTESRQRLCDSLYQVIDHNYEAQFILTSDSISAINTNTSTQPYADAMLMIAHFYKRTEEIQQDVISSAPDKAMQIQLGGYCSQVSLTYHNQLVKHAEQWKHTILLPPF